MSNVSGTPLPFRQPSERVSDREKLARAIAHAGLYDDITYRPTVFHRHYDLYYQTTLPEVLYTPNQIQIPAAPPNMNAAK